MDSMAALFVSFCMTSSVFRFYLHIMDAIDSRGGCVKITKNRYSISSFHSIFSLTLAWFLASQNSPTLIPLNIRAYDENTAFHSNKCDNYLKHLNGGQKMLNVTHDGVCVIVYYDLHLSVIQCDSMRCQCVHSFDNNCHDYNTCSELLIRNNGKTSTYQIVCVCLLYITAH